MTLRLARPTDASCIAAISIEVWIGTYLKRGVSAFFADYALNAFTTQKTEALISDPSQLILVSQNEDGIDGFIRTTSGGQPPLAACPDTEISTLYVQPSHQGKGIGIALLEAALERCGENGVDAVWLTVNAENTSAINFYLTHGFIHLGDTHFHIKDEAYLNHVYARRIS